MKRALLLLLIFFKMSAGSINELENAVLESDLPAVEQLITTVDSISAVEQVGLINLATEVVQKRADLITIYEIKGTVDCPEVEKALVGLNKEAVVYGTRGLKFLLLSTISYLFVGGAIGFSDIFSDSTFDRIVLPATAAVSTAALGVGLLGVSYNFCKFFVACDDLGIARKKRCEELWTSAVKIRQLLYKIVPAN